MREQEWDARVFEIMLLIMGVILGRVGEQSHFGRKDQIKNHHAAPGAVQAAGPRRRDAMSVQTVQHGCQRMVISSVEEYLKTIRKNALSISEAGLVLPARIPARKE